MTDADDDEPLVTGPRGMALLSFHLEEEDALFDGVPAAYSLVALWQGERHLMVYEHARECWELPGGGREPDETPREAAVRELREESGQHIAPEALRFVGFARTAVGPEQRVLYGALYTGDCGDVLPFTANEETSRIHWRLDAEPMPGGGTVQTVDEYLVALCRR